MLTPGGVLMSVSFGQPHFRVPLLLACWRHTWDCCVERFGDAFDYFVYVLRKGRRAQAVEDAQQEAAAAVLGPRVRSRGAEQEAPMHGHMDDESYLLQMAL